MSARHLYREIRGTYSDTRRRKCSIGFQPVSRAQGWRIRLEPMPRFRRSLALSEAVSQPDEPKTDPFSRVTDGLLLLKSRCSFTSLPWMILPPSLMTS
jgi:hypothetical protein